MDAALYVRISEDRSGLAAGVTRQQEDCERRARERGWQVVAVYEDNDITASGKRRRPGFDALIADVESGKATVVIAWSLDRLQRNRRDELRLYEACQRSGASLSLVNGPDVDFTTASGRFVADALGSVARLEIEMKSDRQMRAQSQAASQGRRVGGRRPFGYDQDGVGVRDREADAIRDGYSSLLAGVHLAAIARAWNEAGLTTGQGGSWRHDNVRAVLKNPRYAGKRAYKGEVVAEANWPVLVDPETWQAARSILDDPSRGTGKRAGRYLLTGLALCGVCGSTIHAGGANRSTPMYRCSGSLGHFGRRSVPVDEYVSKVVVERLSRADAAKLLISDDREDVGALRTEANGLRQRLDSLALDFADGELTQSQLRAATARLRARLAEVEARMADAGKVNILGPLVHAEDVRATWDGLDVDRQRAVIDTLAIVRVHPPGRGVRTFNESTVTVEPRRAA